jgi:hypothetical protein
MTDLKREIQSRFVIPSLSKDQTPANIHVDRGLWDKEGVYRELILRLRLLAPLRMTDLKREFQ